MIFQDFDNAFDMVKTQAGVDLGDVTRDDYITDILEESKGFVKGIDENEDPIDIGQYRPYLVAALTMWSSKDEQTITRAEGDAQFRYDKDRLNLRPAVEANLRMQQARDLSTGTEVPIGWDVQTWLDALCGCEGPGQAVGHGSPRYVFSATVV